MESNAYFARIDRKDHMHWIISSFLGLFLFGGGNFMTSYGVSNPYDLKLMGSIGFLILIITNGFAHMIELRIRRKS